MNKPVGVTSATVVARVKGALRSAGTRVKVGHGGTLDKLADGLLLVLVGRATRWFDDLNTHAKTYETTVRLDAFSPTDDAEGPMFRVDGVMPPTREAIAAAVGQFVGAIQQRPPTFSRVHVDGQRSDQRARQADGSTDATTLPPGQPPPGDDQRPAARPVTVHALDVVDYRWPRVRLRAVVSKGTYIRSLARDLGLSLKTGGHCETLTRTAIGPFTLEDAETLPEGRVDAAAAKGWLERLRALPG